MADSEKLTKPGIYTQKVGKPLHISGNHKLADLPRFAEEYGIDLVLHSTGGDGVSAQIETLVVLPKTGGNKI